MKSPLGFRKDYYGGGLMVLTGLAAMFGGTRHPVGTLARMGPGYFPTAVGAILAVVGLLIALSASPAPLDEATQPAVDLRAWSAIIGGSLAFILFGEYGGLVPATFAIVFIAAMGDRDNSPKQAFWLALGMVLIAVIVFKWALQMQLDLFRWGGS